MGLLEKLRARYVVNPSTGCWEWTGTISSKGYAVMYTPWQKRCAGHRLAFELLRGPIPDGLQIDHLCRVRHCVNPAHLEPVTNRENTIRGAAPAAARARAAARTHCKHRHELSTDNVRLDRTGRRVCLACGREKTRRHAGGLIGKRAAGPSRMVKSRTGRTLHLECGHSVVRDCGRPPKRAQCEFCEAVLRSISVGTYTDVKEVA